MLTLKPDAPSAALATWRIAAMVGLAMLLCSRSVNNALESRGGFVTLVPMGGLRYQLPQGGWMFRLTFTPYVPLTGGKARYPKEGTSLGGALSGGYAF